jgi:hypothetical protein
VLFRSYDAAVALLSQSFALNRQPQTLFAWAQAERLRFHCEEAARLFDRFIGMHPPPRQVAAAELAKRRCTPMPITARAPLALPVVSAPAQSVRAPLWYRDLGGGALCGLGAATVAAGLALVIDAHALAARSEGANTLGEAQNHRQAAEQRWAWGLGLTLIGTALVAGGVTRYVWISKADHGFLVSMGSRF